MLSAKELEDLVGSGTGRENRAPFVGLGSFEVTLKRIKMKRDKPQTILIDGKIREIPGKVQAYFIEARVERSSNPKHPVGSDVCVYMGLNGKYEKSDRENAFEFVKAFYDSLGQSIVVGVDATAEVKQQAIESINAVLGNPLTGEFDEGTTRGCRLLLDTNMPKATDKDGKPKAKAPTEEGFLYKNWRPIPQTVEQMLAQRAALG